MIRTLHQAGFRVGALLSPLVSTQSLRRRVALVGIGAVSFHVWPVGMLPASRRFIPVPS
jgi:hypothetical protein